MSNFAHLFALRSVEVYPEKQPTRTGTDQNRIGHRWSGFRSQFFCIFRVSVGLGLS
ncbi:hypothetical protein Hanom_Chr04g00339421 [Helianthus anomalus]